MPKVLYYQLGVRTTFALIPTELVSQLVCKLNNTAKCNDGTAKQSQQKQPMNDNNLPTTI